MSGEGPGPPESSDRPDTADEAQVAELRRIVDRERDIARRSTLEAQRSQRKQRQLEARLAATDARLDQTRRRLRGLLRLRAVRVALFLSRRWRGKADGPAGAEGEPPRPVRTRPDAARPSPDPITSFLPLDTPTLLSGPAVRHEPRLDDDGRLVVLMPHLDLDRMSGGPNTIFQLTARMTREGHRVRYVATLGPLRPDAPTVLDHIGRVTGVDAAPGAIDLVEASGSGATLDVGRDDVLLATWWPTAYTAYEALAHVRAREFVYLVQDYEPGFYQWSTNYALAEATYEMPMRAIVNEPLLLDHLQSAGVGRFADGDNRTARSFMPAVDRTIFARRADRPSSPRRLAFYARPGKPRNLFEIGLRALRLAAAQGVFDRRPWEFCSIGEELPDLPLSERHLMHGSAWLSFEDYGALLGDTDLLLSLMLSPHTSYPPLEMAAAGGLVVTNSFGVKTPEAMAAISPAIRATTPDVDALVGALREAVDEIENGHRPADATLSLPSTWDEALQDVVPWLARQVDDLRRA